MQPQTVKRFTGLIAATFTPMHDDGSLNLGLVPAIVDHLAADGVSALFVCGSTGEGPSLTTAERKAIASAFVEASQGRLPVIVHVGHSCLADARDLAAHASIIGAEAISAMAPFYFKPASVEALVSSLAYIASGAPELPFYYYHIPVMTRVNLPVTDFVHLAAERIPNLAGLKYTAPTVWEFQVCRALSNGRLNMLFGSDEMLLSGLAAGADGAVGSTYNFAAPLYRHIIAAFQAGDMERAERLQLHSAQMVLAMIPYGIQRTLKAMMNLVGLNCGPTRLPQVALTSEEIVSLRRDMERLGFFDWGRTSGE